MPIHKQRLKNARNLVEVRYRGRQRLCPFGLLFVLMDHQLLKVECIGHQILPCANAA